jgi:DNA-binding XRE family transcriptional regulator
MNNSESVEQNHLEATWAPERLTKLREIAKGIAAQRPTPEQLVASGKVSGPYPLGAYMDFLSFLFELKNCRERQGLSLGDISAKTGMSPSAISKLENGHSNPTLQTLLRYIDALGVRLNWGVAEPATVA